MTALGSDIQQLRLPLRQEASQRAADFVVSESNAAATSVLATWPEMAGSVLSIFGPPGSGKSHLAAIFARRANARLWDDADRTASEEALFHAWNAAQASGTPLLIIADALPADWGIALPDLASRLRAVPVLTIGEPDDCLARDLIEALFAQRGMALAPGVASYIVPRMERSYAAIHRVVAALDAASLEKGGGISIRLTRETLLSQGLIDPDLLERQNI